VGETRRERVEGDVPLPRVYLAGRIPTFTTDRYYDADVAATVLATGKASRLYARLVRGRGIATDVGAYAFPLRTGAGILLVRATGFAHVEAEALEAALVEEVEALDETEERELERAVAMNESGLVRRIERVGERADLLSMFHLYFGDPGRLNSEIDRVRAVDGERLRRFAEERLGPENRVLLSYVPGGER